MSFVSCAGEGNSFRIAGGKIISVYIALRFFIHNKPEHSTRLSDNLSRSLTPFGFLPRCQQCNGSGYLGGVLFHTFSSPSSDNLHNSSSLDIYWPFLAFIVMLCVAIWPFWRFIQLEINGTHRQQKRTTVVETERERPNDDDDEWILRSTSTFANKWGEKFWGALAKSYLWSLERNLGWERAFDLRVAQVHWINQNVIKASSQSGAVTLERLWFHFTMRRVRRSIKRSSMQSINNLRWCLNGTFPSFPLFSFG